MQASENDYVEFPQGYAATRLFGVFFSGSFTITDRLRHFRPGIDAAFQRPADTLSGARWSSSIALAWRRLCRVEKAGGRYEALFSFRVGAGFIFSEPAERGRVWSKK